MIRDDAGNALTYWPEGLIAGQDSQTIVIRVDTPQDRLLVAQYDWAKIVALVRLTGSGGPFVELALNPVDLSALPGPYTRFDVKLHAAVDVGPFERLGITVGAERQTGAAWAS